MRRKVSGLAAAVTLIATLISAAPAAFPQSLTVEQVVSGLKKRLAQASSLSLDVEMRWPDGKKTMARIKALRPNYFRVESDAQWFLSDGASTWQYFPAANEYTPYVKYDSGMYVPLASGFTLFSPPANYHPSFTRVEDTVFEGRKAIALVEEPKDQPNLMNRTFIDPETWLPVGEEQRMVDDVTISVYRNVRADDRFTAADFAWAPPKGAADRTKKKSSAPQPLRAGEKAPDFDLPLADGRRIRLGEALKGKKGLLVNFWFINCGFCQAEMPELADLHRRAKDMEIIAVNDFDKIEDIRKFLLKPRFPFPVAVDEGGRTAAAFRVKDWGRPITFLIKPDRTVAYVQIGYDTEKKLEKLKAELAALGISLSN
ncbi:MAG: redoxin domain-containing protein [Acidobacteriota bacterium]|nr:redoxin domain-containing protein [Acidobacteriota bacterium]